MQGNCLARTVAMAAALAAGLAAADTVSIYDIQHTADASGDSPYDGQIVDCAGGVVTREIDRSMPRLVLQDPTRPDGWGGIQVKDWTGGLLDQVAVGDLVTLTNVLVEEYRGNTFLQYDAGNDPDVTVVSSGNPVPEPRPVTTAEIAAPVEGPPGQWHVSDRAAEKYEGMLLTVLDVEVAAMGLGKADDNYNLQSAAGDCWASDYLNPARVDKYHADVGMGADLESVTGVLEQYTKDSIGMDYYQLLTIDAGDVVVPEPTCAALTLVGASLAVVLRRKGE